MKYQNLYLKEVFGLGEYVAEFNEFVVVLGELLHVGGEVLQLLLHVLQVRLWRVQMVGEGECRMEDGKGRSDKWRG